MNVDKVDIHVYEEVNPESEYIVKVFGQYSYSEFHVSGDHLNDFLDRCRLDVSDIYVYKLVRSYEQME